MDRKDLTFLPNNPASFQERATLFCSLKPVHFRIASEEERILALVPSKEIKIDQTAQKEFLYPS